jgi:hypothetical protein
MWMMAQAADGGRLLKASVVAREVVAAISNLWARGEVAGDMSW